MIQMKISILKNFLIFPHSRGDGPGLLPSCLYLYTILIVRTIHTQIVLYKRRDKSHKALRLRLCYNSVKAISRHKKRFFHLNWKVYFSICLNWFHRRQTLLSKLSVFILFFSKQKIMLSVESWMAYFNLIKILSASWVRKFKYNFLALAKNNFLQVIYQRGKILLKNRGEKFWPLSQVMRDIIIS